MYFVSRFLEQARCIIPSNRAAVNTKIEVFFIFYFSAYLPHLYHSYAGKGKILSAFRKDYALIFVKVAPTYSLRMLFFCDSIN